MIRVGALHYTNALPFFYPLSAGHISYQAELVWGTPKEINHMLENGEVDVGMVSSLSFIDRRDDCVLLSDLGIAATESVQSVCLFIPKGTDPRTFTKIYLTKESETSVRLLKVLCHHFWNIFPEYSPSDLLPQELIEEKKPFLSIGDTCLTLLNTPNYTVVDLAKAWNLATGKGFIFALLATNNLSLQKESEAIFEFHRALDRAFHWSQENLPEVIAYARQRIPSVSQDFFFSYYTKYLEYRLSPIHFQGLEYFSQLESSKNKSSASPSAITALLHASKHHETLQP